MKLVEVKELSEKKLEEERIRLQLEAENTRKTRELEEARKLQLSMLPDTIPRLPHLEIAVYMQTATEVGGDYYDFFLEEDGTDAGTLTVAFGDATGHGLQAGTMVAATKSLFNAYASEKEPLRFLQKTSHALKKMGFRKMFMAMTFAKFTGKKMRLSSAGMPFALIFRAAHTSVEEVVLKGMPLGSVKNFPYREAEYALEKGDTVLFMSDGLPEAFNPQKQMFGADGVKKAFLETALLAPEAVITHLVEAGKKWAEGIEFHDDATLMAIKVS
ncbi:MAG: SpoIIE family protein phosphatase [Desulfobacteraceae bacterium]|nr:SpoIIE family protein phosphatase [Desulfobacteraceae bacterium]